MQAAAVDQRRHGLGPDHIDAGADDERETLGRQINDPRRLRDAAVEPRLHRVPLGRTHLGRLSSKQLTRDI